MKDIIKELKKANLLGRGGACFPTGLKWEAVKKEKADKKYVICNASEGELDVFKDKFILEHHADEVIEGIKLALEAVNADEAYIYLNKKYYPHFKKKLEKLIKLSHISLFEKPDNYICGEETTLLNVMEGGDQVPRMKPPYPTQSGLHGYPTLINNVETFYHVSKIAKGEYKDTQFYSISGDVKEEKVHQLPVGLSVKEILKQTGNYPSFPFFVQIGGGACGEILLSKELDCSVTGAGAVIVFNKNKTDLFQLMGKWSGFLINGNCDKCVPCREGVYRIGEMIKTRKINKKEINDLFFVLKNTSYCPLGKRAYIPFESLIKKLL